MKLPSLSIFGASGFALALTACFSKPRSEPAPPLRPVPVPSNPQPFPADSVTQFTLSLADRELGLPERKHIDIPQSRLVKITSLSGSLAEDVRSQILSGLFRDLTSNAKNEAVLQFEQPASLGHSASFHYYVVEAPEIPCSLHAGIDYAVSHSPFPLISRARAVYVDCEEMPGT